MSGEKHNKCELSILRTWQYEKSHCRCICGGVERFDCPHKTKNAAGPSYATHAHVPRHAMPSATKHQTRCQLCDKLPHAPVVTHHPPAQLSVADTHCLCLCSVCCPRHICGPPAGSYGPPPMLPTSLHHRAHGSRTGRPELPHRVTHNTTFFRLHDMWLSQWYVQFLFSFPC